MNWAFSCIIHSGLVMSKVSSQWVPRMLTPEQKACRQQFSEESLDMPRANPENFPLRIITGDETWVHHRDPETWQESMQWKHKGSRTPKKFRVQQSAGKIMATVFLGLRRCSVFGIHATQDNHYWRHLCFHNGVFMWEYQTEMLWKVVGWCPAPSWQYHPHPSHTHRGLL